MKIKVELDAEPQQETEYPKLMKWIVQSHEPQGATLLVLAVSSTAGIVVTDTFPEDAFDIGSYHNDFKVFSNTEFWELYNGSVTLTLSN